MRVGSLASLMLSVLAGKLSDLGECDARLLTLCAFMLIHNMKLSAHGGVVVFSKWLTNCWCLKKRKQP